MLAGEQVERLRRALGRYEHVDKLRDENLQDLSEKAEQLGDYRLYYEARSDWADYLDEAGQELAAVLKEVLG